MAKALIVSAGNNANEYLARHIGELGYTRPTIVASGGEAHRRMDTNALRSHHQHAPAR